VTDCWGKAGMVDACLRRLRLGGTFCYVDTGDPLRSIDSIIEEEGAGISRIAATHCVDMLASAEERDAIAEGKNVYWLTPGWVEYSQLVFQDWDRGKANENFPRHSDGAIVLERILELSDWMEIPLSSARIYLGRLKGLLTTGEVGGRHLVISGAATGPSMAGTPCPSLSTWPSWPSSASPCLPPASGTSSIDGCSRGAASEGIHMLSAVSCIAILLVVLLGGDADAAALRGRIVDAETGEGLPAVTVAVVGAPAVTTDDEGRFQVGGIGVGAHLISVYRLGYTPLERAPLTVRDTVASVEIALHAQPIIFEELVVAAPRFGVQPGRTIGGNQLEDAAPRDVGEYLRTVPGLGAVRRGGAALDLVYRGFRSEQLEVQIDGGTHVYGACPNRMDPPTSHVQSEDLEKIEVLSGPHALRYGPAFGGLVNLVMARPPQLREFSLQTRLETGYETNGSGRRVRISAMGGNDRYDFYLGAGAKDYDDYEDGDGVEVLSGSEVWDYSLKLGYRPSTGERAQVSLRQSFVRDALYPSLPMDADVDDTAILALDYARPLDLGAVDRLTAKVYVSAVDHIMSNRRKPTRAQLLAETDVDARTVGGRLEVGAAVLEGRAFAGADYRDLGMDGDRLRQMGDRAMHDIIWPDAHHRQLGLFGQLERPVGASVLSIGARLDQVSTSAARPEASFVAVSGSHLDRTDLNLSLTAGFVRDIRENLEARLFAGLAQRSPTTAERYLYLLPVGLDRYDYLGSPDLGPETNLQLDAGFRVHREWLDLSVSAYASRLTDYIIARLDTSVAPRSPNVLGVRRFANISGARLMGLELEGGVALRPGLRGHLALAHTRGQDLNLDQPLPEMPPASAVVGLRQTSASDRYWIEVTERLVAAQKRVATEYGESESSSFGVLNVSGGVRLGPHLELWGSVSNLLDAAYSEHLNRRQTSNGEPIAEPGRSVLVRLIART